MLNGKKIIVVLPAYNAELTLEKTYHEIPFQIVDEIILVDDASDDLTFEIGKKLGIKYMIKHEIIEVTAEIRKRAIKKL